MEKPATTDYPIHELLARRWSPRAFADRPVEPEKLRSLWEAARWAPSSYNEQPWSFLIAIRTAQTEYSRLLSCLTGGNIRWAQYAPVLMISIAKLIFEKDGGPNRHAFHDIGLAVGNLVVQATALGLVVHQMAGILPERVKELYGLPSHHEAVAGLALGYPGRLETLPEDIRQRELTERRRKSIAEFVFSERWGRTTDLLPYKPGEPCD